MKRAEVSKLKYKDAGVDIIAEAKGIAALKTALSKICARRPMLTEHFAGMIEFGNYALVMCTDGVGSKIMIANEMRKWDTIGIDCIAMNVNDVICVGAEPLAFVDYLAVQKIDEKIMAEIGRGLAQGAEMANVAILGGETATLPDMVRGLDLAGTCLGYVRKDRIITGQKIGANDIIIGLKSSGPHANGYTLIRRVIAKAGLGYDEKIGNKTLGEWLLTPTAIYVKHIMAVVRQFEIKGLAHITGGGVLNIPRLNKKVRYVITDPIVPQPIFARIQQMGDVPDDEMYRTFNMGMGFAIIVDESVAKDVVKTINEVAEAPEALQVASVVGHVEHGKGVVLEPLDIEFEPL